MSEAQVRDKIYDVVRVVKNVGRVHKYQRWASTWDEYLAHFKTTIGGKEEIRGWTITSQEEDRTGFVASGARSTHNSSDHLFIIRGFMGLDDSRETELTARELTETVMNALDSDTTVLAADTAYYNMGLAQLEVFEPRFFGSTLCHYSEIRQVVQEIRS